MERPEENSSAGLAETAQAIAVGTTSAVDMVEHALRRIDRAEARGLGAFTYVDAEAARDAAERLDLRRAAGESIGALGGVPFGVKELQRVAGWPFTSASQAFEGRRADTTDTLVARMQDADAIALGLTASSELGRSSFCSTPLNGTCRNPWALDRTPGGSSSGSAAAVAAGIVPVATGSDGAGSLRIPASMCGVVGFKPTFGMVPRGPAFAGAADNQSLGVLTTTVMDTAYALAQVVGIEPGERTSQDRSLNLEDVRAAPLQGLRIVFSRDLGYSPVDPGVELLVRSAFDQLRDHLGSRELPFGAWMALPDTSTVFRTLSAYDVWAQVRDLSHEHMALLPASVRQYSDFAARLTADDLIDAQQSRHALVGHVARLFDDVDLLITPTTPTTAFDAEGPMPTRIADVDVDHWGSLRFTYPFNLTGNPAVSVPCGQLDGLPVGMQIVGRRGADAQVLAAAHAFEQVAPWEPVAPGWGDAS